MNDQFLIDTINFITPIMMLFQTNNFPPEAIPIFEKYIKNTAEILEEYFYIDKFDDLVKYGIYPSAA